MFKEDSEKRTMQGCNDCIFDYDGNLWVTAPAGNIAPDEYRRSTAEVSNLPQKGGGDVHMNLFIQDGFGYKTV